MNKPEPPPNDLDTLFIERERAQVTLDSIGDAVASTDFRGHLTYLNKAAEHLTGVPQEAACGRPIGEVFRLVHAVSRRSVDCPVTEAIIENQRRSVAAHCLLRREHTLVPVDVSATPIHDRLGGVVGAVLVAHDVTAARELSDRLAHLALYDHLTGLPNRTLLADRMDRAIGLAKRTGHSFSVLYIDLDNFKEVNDRLGHQAGDQVLQAAADRLLRCVRDSDTVSRQGGDEFLALLINCCDVNAGILCAQKIVSTLSEPYLIDGKHLRLSATVGIALYPSDAADARSLVRAADTAMYRGKGAGRGRYECYSATMATPPVNRLSIE
ncbi:MAG TPA: diguanylate cyclase [Steroidobacteraceae bacterium]|jgi:diguanylate cyclase (GGDEF)-like protein/PAS domain S-box-containing protein|nr:diguanylate cyclase [Steroidobacteraceae bacterium]